MDIPSKIRDVRLAGLHSIWKCIGRLLVAFAREFIRHLAGGNLLNASRLWVAGMLLAGG